MSEVTQSILFRQKLYQNFKDSGMLDKLKTSLRMNLLQKIQKPNLSIEHNDKQIKQKSKPLYLRDKFLACIVAQYFKISHKEYSLSIMLPQAQLNEDDCLNYNQLSEIMNLGNVLSGNNSFLEVLVDQWMKFRAVGVCERSTQTDYSEPVSKKLQDIDKKYRKQIDYWKLIPNSHSNIRSNGQNNSLDSLANEQRMRQKLQFEKKRIRNELQIHIRAEMQKKYEDKYTVRVKEVQKAHEGRLFQLKNRQKTILDSLQRKKKQLEIKAKKINEDQLKMIKKYEIKIDQLEIQYKLKIKELQNKQKQFWKKQLELRAKKKQYEDSIRLVKQKVIQQTLNL